MRNALLETFILVMKHFLMMSQDFFFLMTSVTFCAFPRSEGVIDSLFLITYLALRIGKSEMDDNNNATYMMQGSNFILWATRKSYGRNVYFG